jgi:hypothetical protein
MQLEFVFDNGAAATTRGVQAGDLIVTCANQLGVHIQSSRAVGVADVPGLFVRGYIRPRERVRRQRRYRL